jgi:hypothetical protein
MEIELPQAEAVEKNKENFMLNSIFPKGIL